MTAPRAPAAPDRDYADALEYLQLLTSSSDAARAMTQSFAVGSDMATVTGEGRSEVTENIPECY